MVGNSPVKLGSEWEEVKIYRIELYWKNLRWGECWPFFDKWFWGLGSIFSLLWGIKLFTWRDDFIWKWPKSMYVNKNLLCQDLYLFNDFFLLFFPVKKMIINSIIFDKFVDFGVGWINCNKGAQKGGIFFD
jgi:hypothetical protein